MKIGIFGGTFNPPHLGHLAAAEAAIGALGLDKLYIVPASIPPHKELPEGTPAPEHRLSMAAKLADALLLPEKLEVSSLELDREGKSYTADTLAALHAEYPGAELWLLMGTDMFLTLHLWHDPEAILKLAGVCAFGRAEQDGEALFAPQREHLERAFPGAKITTIPLLIWWRYPRQNCGSCWLREGARSISTRRCMGTFCSSSSTAPAPT